MAPMASMKRTALPPVFQQKYGRLSFDSDELAFATKDTAGKERCSHCGSSGHDIRTCSHTKLQSVTGYVYIKSAFAPIWKKRYVVVSNSKMSIFSTSSKLRSTIDLSSVKAVAPAKWKFSIRLELDNECVFMKGCTEEEHKYWLQLAQFVPAA